MIPNNAVYQSYMYAKLYRNNQLDRDIQKLPKK